MGSSRDLTPKVEPASFAVLTALWALNVVIMERSKLRLQRGVGNEVGWLKSPNSSQTMLKKSAKGLSKEQQAYLVPLEIVGVLSSTLLTYQHLSANGGNLPFVGRALVDDAGVERHGVFVDALPRVERGLASLSTLLDCIFQQPGQNVEGTAKLRRDLPGKSAACLRCGYYSRVHKSLYA